MLIHSSRIKSGDLAKWHEQSQFDEAILHEDKNKSLVEEAELKLVRWSRHRKGYAGVSWGKDSVCLAHMVCELIPDWPLVWVIESPLENPDSYAVRDAFLDQHPGAKYTEIRIDLSPNDIGGFHLGMGLERGFRKACERFGDCHISGVRAQESPTRRIVQRTSAGENPKALAPMIDWDATIVWGYLAKFDLPVHPVYSMNMLGCLERDWLRVSAMTLRRGSNKEMWEQTYYPEFTEYA